MASTVGADPPGASGTRLSDTDAAAVPSTHHWELWYSGVCAVLFAVLTLLVVTGVSDGLDTLVARHFRPVREWGEAQDRYAPWITYLAPPRMLTVLAVVCVGVSLWKRSWRPVAFGVLTALVSAAATLAVKALLARPDPLGGVSPDGGSYPSGHMVVVVASVAGCLLVVHPRVRWWSWLVLAAPCSLMAVSLVVTTQHWVSDVLGGALLAGAVVTASTWLLLRRRRETAAR